MSEPTEREWLEGLRPEDRVPVSASERTLTASERLRTLYEYLPANWPEMRERDSKMRAALPLIADVVESAEAVVGGGTGGQHLALLDALAALREHLEGQ